MMGTILSTIIAALSAVFVGWQVLLLHKQLKQAVSWNRMQASFSFLKDFDDLISEMDLNVIEEIKLLSFEQANITKEDIIQRCNDTQIRKQMFLLCTYFERLAMGVRYKYLDENILHDQLCTVLISYYKNLLIYIQIRREETKQNLCGQFEWLVKRWESGISEK